MAFSCFFAIPHKKRFFFLNDLQNTKISKLPKNIKKNNKTKGLANAN